MKVGCYSSGWLTLTLVALLKTVALVLTQSSQQCQQLMDTCDTMAESPTLRTLATGTESRMATCQQPVHQIMMGDMLEWYVTRTVIDAATAVHTDNTDKYEMSGVRSQMLEVRNVTSGDEGYYFCKVSRGGTIIDQPVSGTCLFVYAPARFQTCLHDMYTTEGGCIGTESLTSQEGQPVKFNIALKHSNAGESCNNQLIQMITFRKVNGPASQIMIECSNSSCQPMNHPRLSVSRGSTESMFNINITLNNLTLADMGAYTAIADIRKPSNNMRVCIYKNFTLVVNESPTIAPPTNGTVSISSTSDSNTSLPNDTLIAIVVVIVVLVLLLIGLGVFVAILLLWTCKHHSKTDESNHKLDGIYSQIDGVLRPGRKKRKKNGGHVSEEAVYRRSYGEEDKVNLQVGLNSETTHV